MSAAYIGSVLEHLPGVVVVFVHFHVTKIINDKLTGVRRKLSFWTRWGRTCSMAIDGALCLNDEKGSDFNMCYDNESIDDKT